MTDTSAAPNTTAAASGWFTTIEHDDGHPMSPHQVQVALAEAGLRIEGKPRGHEDTWEADTEILDVSVAQEILDTGRFTATDQNGVTVTIDGQCDEEEDDDLRQTIADLQDAQIAKARHAHADLDLPGQPPMLDPDAS